MRLATVLAEAVPERDLQENVRVLAKLRGWRYYHTHRSQNSPAGFPDCVLVKNGRIIFAELKRQNAKPSEEQQAWLDDLHLCAVEVYCWRPSDWNDGSIDRVLS